MNADEVSKVARGWFDDAPSLSADLGFEIIDKTQFDFKEWEVECKIFSTVFSNMVKYVVIIHDDVAIGIR